MKIVFFMYGFVGGGAERVTSIIASGLADRGHDVTVMSYDIPRSYPMSGKVKYRYFREATKLKRRIYLVQDMRHAIKELKPDVAIGVMWFYSLWLKVASVCLGIKTIAWDHSSFAAAKKDFKTYLAKYWMYPLHTRTFVLTNEDYKLAYFKRSIVVMPNPMTFMPTKELRIKEKLIIGVGNLSTWHTKGFDLLLQAWSLIENKNKDWKLAIVGRGDETYLNSIIEKLELKNVEICPFRNDVVKVYEQASIFVLSSRTEGFSMVLLEAMSQGCACVACENSGRTNEVLGEGNGLLYATGNIQEMAKEIDYFINHEKERVLYGERAIKQSVKFNTSAILDRWEKILKVELN